MAEGNGPAIGRARTPERRSGQRGVGDGWPAEPYKPDRADTAMLGNHPMASRMSAEWGTAPLDESEAHPAKTIQEHNSCTTYSRGNFDETFSIYLS